MQDSDGTRARLRRLLTDGLAAPVVVGLAMVTCYVPRAIATTDLNALELLWLSIDVFVGWAAMGLLIVALAHGLQARIRSLRWRIAGVVLVAVGLRLLLPMSVQALDLAHHSVGASPQAMRLEFIWTTILCAAGMTAWHDRAARRRRADASLASLRHEQREARRQLVEGRLQVLQARVDPQFFFDMLGRVRDRYELDPTRGEDLLERLTSFLRAALPQLRLPMSTLAQEATLASAYIDLLRESGSRAAVLEVAIDRPAARLPFPPGILLPLLDSALRAPGAADLPVFSLCLSISRHAHGTALALTGTALGGPPAVDDVRRTLHDVYAERASLSVLNAAGSPWSIEVHLRDPGPLLPDRQTARPLPPRPSQVRPRRGQRAQTRRSEASHA